VILEFHQDNVALRVHIAALNDSHQISYLYIYNVVILSTPGLLLSLLLVQDQITLYGATSICLIIGTTLTELVPFAPKVTLLTYTAQFFEHLVEKDEAKNDKIVSRIRYQLKKILDIRIVLSHQLIVPFLLKYYCVPSKLQLPP